VVEGPIRNRATGATFDATPFPPFTPELMAAGGLVAYTRRRLGLQNPPGRKASGPLLKGS
jgi:hypothetical protein